LKCPSKTVCIITNSDFSPPPTRIDYMAKALSSMGWSVTVIAEDLHGKKLPIKERVANYYVIRIPNAPLIHKKLPFFSNPILLFIKLILAFSQNADIYVCVDMFNAILVIFLRLLKKKTIYEIGDDNVTLDSLLFLRRFGLMIFYSSMTKLLRYLEGKVCSSANAVITLTDSLAKERIQFNKNTYAIYLPYHPKVLHDSYQADNNQQKHENYIRLIYEGTISPDKGIYEALQALKILVAKYKNIHFTLIGKFSDKITEQQFYRFLFSYKLAKHVSIIPWMHHDKLEKYLSTGSIGLVLLRPICHSYVISVPNKLIEMMGAGLAIVASKGFPEIEIILLKSRGGILVDSTKPEEIAKAIESLIVNPKLLQEMRINAKNYILKNHSIDNYRSLLNNIFCKVLEDSM